MVSSGLTSVFLNPKMLWWGRGQGSSRTTTQHFPDPSISALYFVILHRTSVTFVLAIQGIDCFIDTQLYLNEILVLGVAQGPTEH